MDNKNIAEYYDATISYYKYTWSRESNALHYGFWDKDTKSVQEALINENKFLARVADLKTDELVLDAGCGIGGSAIWLAKNIGCKVIGITLSEEQLIEAGKLADKNNVSDKTKFEIRDFINTGFPNNKFEAIWAIESVCHAKNKTDFLKEAYRILKPDGRLIVADGFLLRNVLKSEQRIYDNFLGGLVLPNLSKFSEFKDCMETAGFSEIKLWNKTEEIKRSSRSLYKRCFIGYPFFKIGHFLGFIPDIVIKNGPAGIAQYKIVKSGLAGYGVFLGKK